MADPVDTKLKAAKIKLLMNHPFFGVLSSHLIFVEDSTSFKTMATDFKHLYYNRDFVSAISLEETQFVICHEILHCAFSHFLRNKTRDQDLWNMAADYAINWILFRDKIGTPFKPNPKLGMEKILLDEKYKDMCSEEIYEKLLKSCTKIEMPLDAHIYSSGVSKKSGEGAGEDKEGNGSSIDEGAAEDFKDAMINAAKTASQGRFAGTLPGEISRLVNSLRESKVNWRDLLVNSIQSHVKSDVSFQRPAKKSWDTGFILPGRIPEETIKIGYFIDISGSFSNDQIIDAVSEVHGICSMYSSFELYLCCFDTKCNNLEKFTEDNVDELLYWQPTGGGGTHIKSVFDLVRDHELDIDQLVIFTDLEDSSQNDVDESNAPDTVWIISNSHSKNITPPFGNYAYFV